VDDIDRGGTTMSARPVVTGAERIRLFLPIYGLDGGGAERIVINVANNLDRSLFEPIVVLLYCGGRYLDQIRSDVEVIELYKNIEASEGGAAGEKTMWSLGLRRSVKEYLRRRLPPGFIDTYKKIRHGPWVDDMRARARDARESFRDSLQRMRQKRLITYYIEDFGVWRYVTESTRTLEAAFASVLSRRQGPKAIVSNLLLANYLSLRTGPTRGIYTAVCVHNTLKDYQVRVEYKNSPLGQADAIVAVSETIGDILGAKFGRDKIRVIHNPHDIGRIQRSAEEPVEDPWFAEKKVPVVVGIGRLRRQKNFQLLIDAAGDLHRTWGGKVRVVIFGEGPERELLLKRIRRQGLQESVRLMGWVENPFKYLAKADLFVLSSDWEGLPNTLIEAMACGVPVISTDCESGPREILEGGACGVIVGRGKREELARAIRSLLTDKERAASLRQRALVRALDFDISRQVPRYEQLILEGLERKGRQPDPGKK